MSGAVLMYRVSITAIQTLSAEQDEEAKLSKHPGWGGVFHTEPCGQIKVGTRKPSDEEKHDFYPAKSTASQCGFCLKVKILYVPKFKTPAFSFDKSQPLFIGQLLHANKRSRTHGDIRDRI
jgi:hypothetical protein